MKKLFLLLFFCAATAQAVPTLVRTNGNDSASGTTHTVTLPSVALHSVLLLGVRVGSEATLSAKSDSSSNSYVQVGTTETDGAGNHFYVYKVIDAAASAGLTVTITLTAPGATCRMVILEASGCSNVTPVDQVAQNSGSQGTPTSGFTGGLAQSNELVVGLIETDAGKTYTAGSGFTAQQAIPAAPSTKVFLETQIGTYSQAFAATATLSSDGIYSAFCVTLQGVPGPTATATATATASPTPTATATASPTPTATATASVSGVINAASASLTDVQTAVNSAARGDRVNVPAGTATWSGTLTLTKGINLQGAGRDDLTITGTGGYAVLIQPDLTAIANEEIIRVEGFTFIDSANHMIHVEGSCVKKTPASCPGGANATKPFKNLAIGNCRFKNSTTTTSDGGVISVRGQARGVIYNNIFDRCNVLLKNVGNDDPTEWESGNFPFAYGNADNLFFEDNSLMYSSSFSGQDPGWFETGQGQRLVARYNIFNMANSGACTEYWDIHGFQNWPGGVDGGQSGTMITEYYGNLLMNTCGYAWVVHRGSWGLFFDNVMTGGNTGDIKAQQYGVGDNGGSGCCAEIPYPWASPTGNACGHYVPQINNTYVFNNIVNGTIQNMATSLSGCSIAENVNYWNYNPSFTGATGIGRGTSTPTGPCTVGVAYWKCPTAIPTTNSSFIQAGHLYKCLTTNVWTDYYTPYTYPHPLRAVTGEPDPILDPTSLHTVPKLPQGPGRVPSAVHTPWRP